MTVLIIIVSTIFIFSILYKIEPFFWKLYYKFQYNKSKILLNNSNHDFLQKWNQDSKLDLKYINNENLDILSGNYKSYEVEISKINDEQNIQFFQIKIFSKLNIEGKLIITRKYPPRKILGGYHWYVKETTGYYHIDKRVSITTEDDLFLTAILSRRLRELIEKIFEKCRSMVFQSSGVILNFPIYSLMKKNIIRYFLDSAISMMKDMTKDDLKTKLLINIKRNGKSNIKMKNINELGKYYSDHNDVVSFLKEMVTMKNIGIQLTAARYLKDDGLLHSLNILKNTRYLSSKNKIEIVKTIEYNNYEEAKELLVKMFKETSSSDLKIQVLKTLEKFNYENFVPFLLDEYKLQRNKDIDIKLRLAEMIVDYGDKSLVKEIKLYIKQLHPDLVPTEIAEIIIKIESKLEKRIGMLSGVDADGKEGKLSFPDDDLKGGLSKSGDER